MLLSQLRASGASEEELRAHGIVAIRPKRAPNSRRCLRTMIRLIRLPSRHWMLRILPKNRLRAGRARRHG